MARAPLDCRGSWLPVAPLWHTLLLVAILFLFALGGARLQSPSSSPAVRLDLAAGQDSFAVYFRSAEAF